MAVEFIEILAAPLVEIMRKRGIALPGPPARYYPDGSLRTTNLGPDADLIQNVLWQQLGGYGSFFWRALAPFGNEQYTVTYPGWYNILLCRYHEGGMAAVPSLNPISQEERDLAHIRIAVHLRRKFTEKTADDLARALREWFKAVGSRGVFGESGVSSISPQMHYSKTAAIFELDLSQSGQETLNTLVLAILGWGMSTRRPLDWIAMAADEYEPSLKSQLVVPLGEFLRE